MGILEWLKTRRSVQTKAIATYRAARDAGLDHDAASDAVIAAVKADHQPTSDAGVQPAATDLNKWVQIIQFVLQILALFAK